MHTALAEHEIREERTAGLADHAARRKNVRESADCFGYERFVPNEEDLVSARQSFLCCAAESCEIADAIAAGSSLAVSVADSSTTSTNAPMTRRRRRSLPRPSTIRAAACRAPRRSH